MTDHAPVDWSQVALPAVRLGLARKGTYYVLRSDFHPGWLAAYQTFWPRHWNKTTRGYEIPMGPGLLEQIKKTFGQYLIIDQDALEQGARKAEERAQGEILRMQVEQGIEIPLPEGIQFHTEPYKHQRHALAMALQRKSFGLFMEMGCVAGWTKILNPMTGGYSYIDELAKIGRPFPVLAYAGGGKLRLAYAAKAFQKGHARIFTVFLASGRSIACTRDHAFLTKEGWKHLRDVYLGDAIGVAPAEYGRVPVWSTSESSHAAHDEDARHSTRKEQGFLADCSGDSRQGDALLPQGADIARASSPSQGDAPEQSDSELPRTDATEPTPDDTRLCRCAPRHATLGCRLHDISSYKESDAALGHLGNFEAGLLDEEKVAELTPFLSEAQSTFLLNRGTKLGDQSYENPPLVDFDVVESITDTGLYPFYDMHVPGYESYVAEGIVNHNTGKTKVILDLIAELKREAENEWIAPDVEGGPHWEPALILCPVAVLENWARQTLIHQPYLKAVPLIKGSSTDKATLLHSLRVRGAADLIICNYETAWRIQDEFKQYYWSAVILDESTRIKARGAKQSKGALKIGAWGRRRYILTGTPMPNSPLELFNQIKFLDPTVLGPNFYAFRDRYAVMGGYGGYQVVGWKNLDELSKQLAGITYMVKKKDCLDLPEKVYKDYRFPMPETTEKAYRAMAETLVTEVQGKVVSVDVILAKLTKLRQITSGFMYNGEDVLRFSTNPKLDKCMEIIDDMADDHKIVVWTMFKEELDALEKGLSDLNNLRAKEGRPTFAHVRLDGSSTGRGEIIRNFQEEPKTRIFLGQQKAGGIGIDLYAADYCVFFSNDYSPETRLQAEDRLHRIGQKNNVTYVDLLMRGTIDVSIKATLARKAKITAIVEGNGLKEMIYGAVDIEPDGDGPGEALRGDFGTGPGSR